MGLLFSMWVDTENPNQAKAIKEFFDGRQITANGKDYQVGASAETGKVSVGGISNSGVNSQSDEDELSALGFEFYKILKYAPPKYRYAMTGVEVDECVTMKELEEDPDNMSGDPGWVIRKDIYKKIGCTEELDEFNSEYLWNPYEGEEWIR